MSVLRRVRRAAVRVWEIIVATVNRYDDQHGDLLAAAFALYTLLALAPLAVIAVTLAGLLIEPEQARAFLVSTMERSSSADIAALMERLLEAVQQQRSSLAAVLATLVLVWAASKLFLVAQEALNAIWGVQPRPAASVLVSIRRVAWKRAVSFAMVLGCGGLLLVMLTLQTTISALSDNLLQRLGLSAFGSSLAFVQQLGLSFVLLSLVFAVIYRVLPDARIKWSDVWVGSAFTAGIVLIGTTLLSLYLSHIAPGWLAGAVGSVGALLLWSYYLAQVFLLGAALTRELACQDGQTRKPEPYAELRDVAEAPH
jgi:membrane protein